VISGSVQYLLAAVVQRSALLVLSSYLVFDRVHLAITRGASTLVCISASAASALMKAAAFIVSFQKNRWLPLLIVSHFRVL
jgi:hypothetical protein